MRRNYKIEYSHRAIQGTMVISAEDSTSACRAARGKLDFRFGKSNWTMHSVRYAGGRSKGLPCDGKPTIMRKFPTPPPKNPRVISNYAAMEKYGAWQYKV